MQRPLEITWHELDPSPALEALIHERVAALERHYPRLIGCRVRINAPHRSAGGTAFDLTVTVEAEVPGRNSIIGKGEQRQQSTRRDHATPVQEAFDAVMRQLDRLSDVRHADTIAHERISQSGMIVSLFPDQHYGFIEVDGSPELYFTENAVVGGAFSELQEGMLVEVTVATTSGPMGPQASSVRLLDKVKTPR